MEAENIGEEIVEEPNRCEGDSKQSVFATTHWSLILQAGDDESSERTRAQALESLCQTYWYPIYSFVRRQGVGSHDAQDLTQGFFAALLSKDSLSSIDRSKGKFRSFLLAAMKNFLVDEHRRASAVKRGGKSVTVSINDEDAENRFQREPSSDESPDRLFERAWVVTLLDRVMSILSEEQSGAGKSQLFERLKSQISRETGAVPYRVVADQFGMTEEAVKKTVQRLRQRYGILLRSEISQTVSSPELVDEELASLLQVW